MSDRDTNRREWWPAPFHLFGLLIFLLLFWIILLPQLGNTYSQDSYAYYLLGDAVFKGNGFSVSAIRDLYAVPRFPSPSRSFPPLFPFFIGLFDWAFGARIYSGTYINLIVLAISIIIHYVFSRIIAPANWPLVFAALPIFFLLNGAYRDEIAAGRSIPLSMLLLLTLLIVFVKATKLRSRSNIQACSVGLCLALMVLTRFDQTTFAVCFPIAAMCIYLSQGIPLKVALKSGILICVSFFLFLAPWGIRNIVLFGKFFASDNSIAIFSTISLIVPITFYESPAAPLAFSDPTLWIAQRTDYLKSNLFLVTGETKWLIFLVPILFVYSFKRMSHQHVKFFVTLLLYAISNILTISLTPYYDSRYFSVLCYLIIMGLCIILAILLEQQSTKNILILNSLLFSIIILLIFAKGHFYSALTDSKAKKHLNIIPNNIEDQSKYYKRMISTFETQLNLPGRPIIAIDDAESFHYFTGLPSLYIPVNIYSNHADFQAWLARWKPDYIIRTRQWVRAMALQYAVVSDFSDDIELLAVSRIRTRIHRSRPATAAGTSWP